MIKSGNVIIENHEFRRDFYGKFLHTEPEYDESIVAEVRPFFESYYSIEFPNYAVNDSYLHDHEVIATV